MNLLATINAIVTALAGIPAAVTAAKASLQDFEAFLAANV